MCYNIPVECGNGSTVERHLPKVNVASSNLVSRSKKSHQSHIKIDGFFHMNETVLITYALKILALWQSVKRIGGKDNATTA